jgi:prepilin-type processing-associated H-X9-DG protein/prepilin-type N-terminal cleavage/methylation domain-containing protein
MGLEFGRGWCVVHNVGRRHSRQAFTITELLVVIAIIVILVALIMPSMGAAKRLAQATVCRSNLHQMGTGMLGYAESTGYFPGSYALPVGTGGNPIAVWPVRIRNYMNGGNRTASQVVFNCPSAPLGYNWQAVTGTGPAYANMWDAGLGYNYDAASGKGELLLDTYNVPFDYGYNDWGVDNPQPVGWRPQRGLGGDQWRVPFQPTARIKNPNMIAIADGVSGNWNYNIDPMNPGEFPGARHSSGCNIVYIDGHVEWHLQSEVLLYDLTAGSPYATWSGAAHSLSVAAQYRPAWAHIAPMWNSDGDASFGD